METLSKPSKNYYVVVVVNRSFFYFDPFCFPSLFGRLSFNVFEVFETHSHTHTHNETTSSSLFHYQISKLGRVPKFIDSILGGAGKQVARWAALLFFILN
jgi:hypothetical protein